MAEYLATIKWKRSHGELMKGYSREHTWGLGGGAIISALALSAFGAAAVL